MAAFFIVRRTSADAGNGALPLFIAVTVIWTVTSAALRAPPLMLLGKYAARPQLPWLAALVMLALLWLVVRARRIADTVDASEAVPTPQRTATTNV